MTSENIRALVQYRLEQADESLQAACLLIEHNLFRQAVNRSDYAMYYAVLALLATVKKKTSKHSGVISLFDKKFVKKGIFPKELSRWLHGAFDLRQRSDYGADQTVSDSDARTMPDNSRLFVGRIYSLLKDQSDLAHRNSRQRFS
jgi:uncharacterized protein (UPF0332 family)